MKHILTTIIILVLFIPINSDAGRRADGRCSRDIIMHLSEREYASLKVPGETTFDQVRLDALAQRVAGVENIRFGVVSGFLCMMHMSLAQRVREDDALRACREFFQ